MSVVQLYYGLFGEFLPIRMLFPESAQDVPQGARHEEILLNQAEFFASLGLIVGVQHLRYGFPDCLRANRLDISTLVEGAKVQLLGRLGLP